MNLIQDSVYNKYCSQKIKRILKNKERFCLFIKDGKWCLKMDCDCKNKNSGIRCTVQACKYNMGTENYCSLDTISIGTHEANPTVPECTDCNSFVKR